MNALYTPDWPAFMLLLGWTNDPQPVELLGFNETGMARIRAPVQEGSPLAIYAKAHGLPPPGPIERLVPADRVTSDDASSR